MERDDIEHAVNWPGKLGIPGTFGGPPLAEVPAPPHATASQDAAAPPSADQVPAEGAPGGPDPTSGSPDQAWHADPDAEIHEAVMSHEAVRPFLAPTVARLKEDFAAVNEPAGTFEAAETWARSLASGAIPPPGEHPYDLSRWSRVIRDRSRLHSFATAMAGAGASQAAVDSMIGNFLELKNASSRGPMAAAQAKAYREILASRRGT